MQKFLGQFGHICQMIKIEHSIFALPYAWAGTILAARGWPGWKIMVFLTLAMVAVRSFAMTFNRIVDLRYDLENPRTSKRPLCTGEISPRAAKWFCLIAGFVFVLSCMYINLTCLLLSVPALIFSATYSLLKRYTPLCHYWLGATLGLAPLAGWLAYTPDSLGLPAIMLFLGVTFWVGAFDVYYSFQDLDFDRRSGLHSLPADTGGECAMHLAAFSHILTIIFFLLTGLSAHLGWPWYVLCCGVGLLLLWEHRLVKPEDLRHVNTAFFTLNGIISPLILAGVILGIIF